MNESAAHGAPVGDPPCSPPKKCCTLTFSKKKKWSFTSVLKHEHITQHQSAGASEIWLPSCQSAPQLCREAPAMDSTLSKRLFSPPLDLSVTLRSYLPRAVKGPLCILTLWKDKSSNFFFYKRAGTDNSIYAVEPLPPRQAKYRGGFSARGQLTSDHGCNAFFFFYLP